MSLSLPNDHKRADARVVSPNGLWHPLRLSVLTIALGLAVFRTYAFVANIDTAPLDRFILPILIAVLACELFYTASVWGSTAETRRASSDARNRDTIAGFYSGEALTSMIEREVSRAGRAGRSLAILMIDVTSAGVEEDFSSQSAKLEHLTRVIRDTTRNSDVLGRMDPGELALILTDTPAENAAIVIEKLRGKLLSTDVSQFNVKLVTARQDGDGKGIIWRCDEQV